MVLTLYDTWNISFSGLCLIVFTLAHTWHFVCFHCKLVGYMNFLLQFFFHSCIFVVVRLRFTVYKFDMLLCALFFCRFECPYLYSVIFFYSLKYYVVPLYATIFRLSFRLLTNQNEFPHLDVCVCIVLQLVLDARKNDKTHAHLCSTQLARTPKIHGEHSQWSDRPTIANVLLIEMCWYCYCHLLWLRFCFVPPFDGYFLNHTHVLN